MTHEPNRSEDELAKTDLRVENILSSISDSFYTFDRDFRYVYVNEAMTKMFGIGAEDFLGKTLWDLFPDVEGNRFHSEAKRAFDEQKPCIFENYYAPLNRWFENRIYPSPDGLSVFTTEITERKRNEINRKFLFEIAETIRRAEGEAEDLLFAVAKSVGEHLKIRRCFFNEINLELDREIIHRDYCRAVESIAGVHRISVYSPQTTADIEAGKTIVNRDSETDERTAALYEQTYAPAGERAYVAVPLLRGGSWVASLWASDDEPRDWTSAEINLLEIVAERAWLAVEKMRGEAEVRKSEERYRTLFDSIDEGFCVIEMLYDESGKPNDWRFLEVNPAFEKHNSIERAKGKTIRELAPNIEAKWFEIYGRVAATGEPSRFSEDSPALNRWFDVYAFRVGEPEERKLAVLFNDFSERRAAEEKLRFLFALSSALQAVAEPEEIMRVTARMLGEHLQVNRCAYAEVFEDENSFRITGDYTRDTFSIVGEYKMSDFGEEALRLMRAGKAYVFDDAEHDARAASNIESYRQMEVAAAVSVPLRKNERFAAVMAVHQTKTPRIWTAEEIDLVRLVVNRCWEAIERARALRDLRQSEERFRSLFDSIDEGFCTIEVIYDDAGRAVDHRILEANPAFTKHTGLENPQGKLASELVPGIEQLWTDIYAQVIETGESKRVEGNSSALVRWLDVLVSPVGDADSRRVAVIFSDITARKLTEEALQKSEAEFRRLANAVPQIVWVASADGKTEYINEQWLEFSGLPAETIGNRELSREIVHPDDREKIYTAWTQAHETGAPFEIEGRMRHHKTGEYHWFLMRSEPTKNERGEIVKWFGTSTDITATKRAEKAVRESEEKFRNLANSISQLAWIAEADGNIFWYNERWFDYTGTTLEEMQGWGWQAVHDPSEVERVTEKFKRHIASGEIWEDTFPIRSKTGEFRWFLSRALPIRDESGNVVRWFGTNTDIEELREARLSAEKANRLKDEFLATLSHELRTPLNSILGWSQILQKRSLDEAETKKALATIERSARSQSQLIDDLLDVSRITTGKLRLNVRAVDLSSVISAAIDAARPAAEAKNIRLQTLLDSQAGPISGDPDRLQQVVWNLLSNAVKFTPKNGRVQVRLERVNSHVEIVISDTGRGIEAEFLPYVFDRFRQSDGSMTRRHGGLGLGLAIARQLVELHGGNVSVTSAGENTGATFTVSLPLLPVRSEPATDMPRVHPTAEAVREGARNAPTGEDCDPELDGLRVLLVDDEIDSRELLSTVLESCGAVVAAAGSAREAFDAVSRETFDIIISDIGMPEEDGFALIARIRELPREQGGGIPAIALTAYARSEDRIQALRSGFQMHIAKPVEPSELIAVVANLAGRIGS